MCVALSLYIEHHNLNDQRSPTGETRARSIFPIWPSLTQRRARVCRGVDSVFRPSCSSLLSLVFLMSTSFSLSPLSLYFPIHDPCFGDPSNSSSVCQVPTNEMIAFLNISNPTAYLEAYCLNPPIDSCAFGYCSNPDVASPAVRISSAYSRCLDSKMTHYTVSLYHDDCLGNPRTIFPRRRPSLSTCDSRLI
jgi:hypothetical protein